MSDYEVRQLARSMCASKEPCDYHLMIARRIWRGESVPSRKARPARPTADLDPKQNWVDRYDRGLE